jgi:CRISPR-associated protein Cmr4
MPIIHASSLKGALKEFFKNKWGSCDNRLNHIFGPDSSCPAKGVGNYKFMQADLLVLPVRSNTKPFYRATAKMLVDTINNKATAFGMGNIVLGKYDGYIKPAVKDTGSVRLENWNATTGQNIDVWDKMGEDVAVFDDNTFKQLAKHLPVIARNHLENGESKNLWYEEVVPRESRFVFFVSHPDGDANLKDFTDTFINNTIHIGANASIGYGFVKIEKL